MDLEDNDIPAETPAVSKSAADFARDTWIQAQVDAGSNKEWAQGEADKLAAYAPRYWEVQAEKEGYIQVTDPDTEVVSWTTPEPEEVKVILSEADAEKALKKQTGSIESLNQRLKLDDWAKSLEKVYSRQTHLDPVTLAEYEKTPFAYQHVTAEQAFDAHAKKLGMSSDELALQMMQAGVGREALEADILGGMPRQKALDAARSRGALAFQSKTAQAEGLQAAEELRQAIQKAQDEGTDLPASVGMSRLSYIVPEGVTADWGGTDPANIKELARYGEAGWRDSMALIQFYASDETEEGKSVSQLHGLYNAETAGWQHYIDGRMEHLLKDNPAPTLTQKKRAKHQALNELAAWKTVGMWTAPIFIPWDYLESGEVTWKDALMPTVELVGYTNTDKRGNREIIFYQSDAIKTGFEVLDIPLSLATGAFEYTVGWDEESTSLSEAMKMGLFHKKEPLSSSIEHLPEDASMTRKVLQVGAGGLSLFALPDLITGAALTTRVAKRVGDLGTAGKINREANNLLEQIAENRALGEYLEAERLEGVLRSKYDELAKDLDRVDADIAQRLSIENPNILGEGAEELGRKLADLDAKYVDGKVIPGEAGRDLIHAHGSMMKPGGSRPAKLADQGQAKPFIYGTQRHLDELEALKSRIVARGEDPATLARRRQVATAGDFKSMLKALNKAKGARAIKMAFLDKVADSLKTTKLDDAWSTMMNKAVDDLALIGPGAARTKRALKQSLEEMKQRVGKIKNKVADDLKVIDDAIAAVKVNNESRAIAAIHLRDQIRAHYKMKPKAFTPQLRRLKEKVHELPKLSDEAALFVRRAQRAGWTTEDAVLSARLADARANTWAKETGREAGAWWETRIAGVRSKDDFIKRFMTDPDSPEGMAMTALPDGYRLRQNDDGYWFVVDDFGKELGKRELDPFDAAASAIDGLVKQGVITRLASDTYPTRVDVTLLGHRLEDAEYNISKMPYEIAVGYRPDGQTIRMTQRSRDSVSFNQKDILNLIRSDNVDPGGFGKLTHNHPSGVKDNVTSGFSGADISLAALIGLKEMRATGIGGSWVLTIDDWGGMSRGVLYRQGEKKAVTGKKSDRPEIAAFEKDLTGGGFGQTSHVQEIINRTFREVRSAGGTEAEALELFNKRWLGTGEEAWLRQNGLKSLPDILGDHGVSFRLRLEPRVERGRPGQDAQQDFAKLARSAREDQSVDLFFQQQARQAHEALQGTVDNILRDPEIGPKLERWFGGSTVVTRDGKPLVVFHGTSSPVDFDAFATTAITANYLEGFGTHLGTLTAANRFLFDNDVVKAFPPAADTAGPRVIPAFVRIENPVYLPDLGGWEPGSLMSALRGEKVPPTGKHSFELELEMLVSEGVMTLSQMEKSLAKFDDQVEVLKRAGIDDFYKSIEDDLLKQELATTRSWTDYRVDPTDAQKLDAFEKTKALHAKIHNFLESAGFDGARYRAQEGGTYVGEGGIHDAYVIFKPQQAKGIYGSKYTEDARLVFQEQDATLKAATEFTQDGRAYIYALEEPNVSSMVHELGHIFRRDLDVNDMDTVSTWLKTEHGIEVTHEANRFVGSAADVERAEELFAEAFEAYVMSAKKAPTSTLDRVFEKLKTLMVQIYRQVGLDVKMTDEMRDVMNRLLVESGPTEKLFPAAQKTITAQLLGPPENRLIGVLAHVAEEARRLGIPGMKTDKMRRQLETTGQIVIDKPIMFERAGIGRVNDNGEYVLTRRDVSRLQDELEREAYMAQAAKAPDLAILSRAHRTASTETSPTEKLRNWLEGDPHPANYPGRMGKAVARYTATAIFGGDPLRATAGKQPLRLLPDHMRKTILAGTRGVEHAVGETVRLVAEGDWKRLTEYLGGNGTVQFKISGRPVTSAGVDSVSRVFDDLHHAFNVTGGSKQVDLLQDLCDRFRPGLSRKQLNKADRDLKGLKKVGGEDAARFERMNQAFLSVFKLDGQGDELPSFMYDVRQALGISTPIRPIKDMQLMETLLFHSGVTKRNGKLARETEGIDSSAKVAESLLKDIEKIQGRAEAARVAVLLSTHGHAANARNMWARMGVGVSSRDKELFLKWSQGDYIPPKDIPRMKKLSKTHGLESWLENDPAILNFDFYVPKAARERMAEAMAKGREGTSGEKWWLASEQNIDNVIGMAVRFQKLRMTRGNFLIRQRYFFMNTVDHFNQMAMTVGFRPALASTARVLLQDVMVLPGVARTIYFLQKGGILDAAAAEKLRQALQKVGDKAAHAVGTLFGGAKYRMEVNPILEGIDGSFVFKGRHSDVPDKVYSYREIREIAIQEGVFASFDTTQLKNAIKKTRSDYANLILRSTNESVELGALPQRAVQKAKAGLQDVMQMTSDTAEAWSERERLGAMVTLMEAGIPPRQAARLTIDALYDYAGTMTTLDRHIITTMLFPFWAFQKNANKQVFDRMFSPWGAYRMSVLRHMHEGGVETLNYILHESVADPYGLSEQQLRDLEADPVASANYWAARQVLEYGTGPLEDLYPEQQQQVAFMVWGANQPLTSDGKVDWSQMDPEMRQMMENGYGGIENVPDDAKLALFMLVTDKDHMVQDGVLLQLHERLMKGGGGELVQRQTGLADYAIPKGSVGDRPAYLRSRLAIKVPYHATESVRNYYGAMKLFRPDHPYTELFVPESTVTAGYRHILGVLTAEASLAAWGASLAGPVGRKMFEPEERSWENPDESILQAMRDVDSPIDPSLLPGIDEGKGHEFLEPMTAHLAKRQFAQSLKSVVDVRRSPFLGPIMADVGLSEFGTMRRIHPHIASLIESSLGVELLTIESKELGPGGKYDQQLAILEASTEPGDKEEAMRLRTLLADIAGEETVTVEEERKYMYPGFWQYSFELTLGEVNALMLGQAYGTTPLETAAGDQGRAVNLLRVLTGMQTAETQPSRTAGRETVRFPATTKQPPKK